MDLRYAEQYFGTDARNIGCPFARRLLDQLGDVETEEPIIVDSWLSMLKPGWYPCIPGWHYDEIARKPDGSLDWRNNRWDKKHYIMVIDEGTGSLTQIARPRLMFNTVHFPLVNDYTELNQWMEQKQNRDLYWTQTVQSGRMYLLCNTTPHRGTPATGSGWRYFIRATINSQRKIVNETRTQTQVYVPAIDKGW